MEFLENALGTLRTHIPAYEIFIRMLLAAGLGAVIGLDREYRNRPAGLRTHMSVSLAAATFGILGFELFFSMQDYTDNPQADVIRVIEAVTAGVAFLAAGSIIRSRGRVRGLTTGASLWLAGAIGLACGAGQYPVALFATVLGLLILVVLRFAERMIRPEETPAKTTNADQSTDVRDPARPDGDDVESQ